MNWRILIILSLIISLSGARIAMAHEKHQHQKAPDTSSLGAKENHDMDGMDMSDGHDMDGMDMGDGHDMDGMDMSDGHDMDSMKDDGKSGQHEGHDMDSMKDDGKGGQHDGHDMEGMTEGDDMEGMDMGGSHSHGPVKETPPNVKVLGTFGAINLSFVVIGLWNKLFRRKGGSDGTSK